MVHAVPCNPKLQIFDSFDLFASHPPKTKRNLPACALVRSQQNRRRRKNRTCRPSSRNRKFSPKVSSLQKNTNPLLSFTPQPQPVKPRREIFYTQLKGRFSNLPLPMRQNPPRHITHFRVDFFGKNIRTRLNKQPPGCRIGVNEKG